MDFLNLITHSKDLMMTELETINITLAKAKLDVSLIMKGGKNIFTVTDSKAGRNWKFNSLSELEAFEKGIKFALTCHFR